MLAAQMNAITTPVQVGTQTNWAEIAGGDLHSIAIKTDGTIYHWGAGYNGALNNVNYPFNLSPVKIGTGSAWSKVTANGRFNIALQTNGTAWGWGVNSRGQLGIGNTSYQANPVQISGTTWQAVSAGGQHVVGKKT
ncbi:Regulator of chromosome condensation (RCC1) repeat protein [compost metagenome]